MPRDSLSRCLLSPLGFCLGRCTSQVVQTGILLLIIFSTILILVQSYVECKWVQGTICVGTVCTPFDELTSCDPMSFTSSDERCTRVCPKRLEPLEPGGPVHFFVMDAFCIGIFTIEFVARMLCSPATVGLRTFMLSLANWIDVIAIVPFYVDVVFIMAAAESDLKVLAILRIVRLTRILRVLKFSKSLRGVRPAAAIPPTSAAPARHDSSPASL